MSKEIDTKIECCEIWNSLKDKTKMIDFLINAKTEIDQLKQENEALFLQLSKQEIDEHKPVYCTLAGNDCKYLGKIKELKQQLSEKDKEIEKLKQQYTILENENGKLTTELIMDKYKKAQKEVSFGKQLAIQELEKVKMLTEWKFESIADVVNQIDQQIKELKGENDERI